MAQNPDQVQAFWKNYYQKQSHAEKEFESLKAYAKEKCGIDAFEPWDNAYVAEKMRKEKFDLDDETLKPYFKLENAIEGVFQVSSKLFDLEFKAIDHIEKYHEEVKTYEVLENGIPKAILCRFHPRAGKRAGAWMTSFKSQFRK